MKRSSLSNILRFNFMLFVISFSLTLPAQNTIPVKDAKGEPQQVQPQQSPDTGQQEQAELPPIRHKIDLGAGMGLDYGGLLGVQLGYSPVKHLLIFASGGYHLIEFGWELGVKGIYPSNTIDHVFRPYAKLMYGNNSVIYVEGLEEYNKTYKGLTAGLGAQIRFGRMKANGLDFDLNLLFRSQEYKDDYETLKNDPRVEIVSDPVPISFSIGYHHEF